MKCVDLITIFLFDVVTRRIVVVVGVWEEIRDK